jgi:hypothetical protein
MKTIRFTKPEIKFNENGLTIIGTCYNDNAIYLPYSRIKTIEYNKNLMQTNNNEQQSHFFIVCEHDEYYEIEGKASNLSMTLMELFEKIK